MLGWQDRRQVGKVDGSARRQVVRVGFVDMPLWLYTIVFFAALAFQGVSSWSALRHTALCGSWCGNALLKVAQSWGVWLGRTILGGLVMLPGAIWAIRHWSRWPATIFRLGWVGYIVVVAFMLRVRALVRISDDMFFFAAILIGAVIALIAIPVVLVKLIARVFGFITTRLYPYAHKAD